MSSVLIVEDDLSIQENLTEFLEYEGYSVLTASNGLNAIELLRSTTQLPFVILLDLMMPVMDGIQFRKEQEKDARIATIPVILMSADPQIEVVKLKIGATSHLKKPLDIEILSEILKKFEKKDD